MQRSTRCPHWGYVLVFVFLVANVLSCPDALAQEGGYIQGKVKDKANKPIPDANVTAIQQGSNQVFGAKTDSAGAFSIAVPQGKYSVQAQHVSYGADPIPTEIGPGSVVPLIFVMSDKIMELDPTLIHGAGGKTQVQISAFDEIAPIDPSDMYTRPTPKNDIESLIMTMPGVSGLSEFSSQYRVRGGNYDENLVYIDDVEIYRPQLIRQGQQEGLGFTNPNLADNVTFSTGGFQAKYGDKLSSVLNIQYKDPIEFKGSVELGILTQNIHLEGMFKKKDAPYNAGRFSYAVGFRHFSTAYLLNTLDTQGEYRPDFLDLQAIFRYKPKTKARTMLERPRTDGTVDTIYLPSEPLKLSLLVITTRNDYVFTPASRETTFGNIARAFRLFVAFEGQEVTRYLTGQAAFTVDHAPRLNLRFKYILSAFQSNEDEIFTVEGGYRLADISTDFGNDNFNEIIAIRGVGTELRYARNYLDVNVLNFTMRGEWYPRKAAQAKSYIPHKLRWGLSAQQDIIVDKLYEWNAIDSAQYLRMGEFIQANNTLTSNRFWAFGQYEVQFGPSFKAILGARLNYWTLNKELLFSPRLQLVYSPQPKGDSSNAFQLRFAAGAYQQPPFYRELRDFNGQLNRNLPAQKSYHFVLGGDYTFKLWRRNFKIFAEVYYKYLYDVVPYEFENVRIRYYPNNVATGALYGFDFKINGQFLREIDSWLSFSVLKAEEKILGINTDYVPRPSDQRFQLSFYFQDELPLNPTFKMHLNLVYSGGLPFGPPQVIQNRTALRAPAYMRVDLGVSKMILLNKRSDNKFGLESLWISAEVFNLFARENTVSYTWIQDVFNTQFPVPNYLSQRLFNVRLLARFK